MKQINNYISNKINESANSDFIDFVNTLHFALTNGRTNTTQNERFELAKNQEQEVANIINRNSSRYIASRLETFYTSSGKKFSTKIDLEQGDVIVVDTQTGQAYFIDVKVGSSKTLFGLITANSLVNFAKNSVNHFYLVFNGDATDKLFINANKLYAAFEESPVLYASKVRNKSIRLNAEIVIPSNLSIEDDGNVYAEDYIGTKWLKDHKTLLT